jgi:predicted Rossmann-fold nucleotide-binding protein
MCAVDGTPDEIESLPELREWLDKNTLAGLVVQGLDLTDVDLRHVDVSGTLFLGCRTAAGVDAALIGRGAQIVPVFHDVPYPTHPSALYTANELAAGFADGGFAGMFDTRIYAHFLAQGGPLPPVREALAQRLHDHGVDDALGDALDAWHSSASGLVIGVMGGHAELRGSVAYVEAAALGRALTRAGALVLTGGGPGVMEAANLGGLTADLPDAALPSAVNDLTAAPHFGDHEPYTAVALQVRRALTAAMPDGPWARRGGLSIPTWLYGHEPANLFAGRIAKYFSNAIREDTILRACRGGIVFAPGRAGTVQEVFQAATKAYYGSDGASGPMVFLDRRYWTEVLPIEALLRPLFAQGGDPDALQALVHVTDDIDEAVTLLTAVPASGEA